MGKGRKRYTGAKYLVGSDRYREFCDAGNVARPQIISVSITEDMKRFLEQEAERKGVSINFEAFDRLLNLHGLELDGLDIVTASSRMKAFGQAASRALAHA